MIRKIRKKVTVIVLVGFIGSGKTLVCTAIADAVDKSRKCRVYANYDIIGLKNFTKISDTSFVDEIPNDKEAKIVIIDEVGTGGRNYNTQQLERLNILARKLIGENTIIFYISPEEDHIDIGLLRMSDLKGVPVVFEYLNKPYIGAVKLYRKSGKYRFRDKASSVIPFKDLDVVCEQYNTGDVTESIRDGQYKQVWGKLNRFQDRDVRKKNNITKVVLASRIHRLLGNISDVKANTFASRIMSGDDPDEII